VIPTGQARLLPRVSGQQLEAAVPGDAERAFLRTLGVRSAMVVPMVARGRVLGALTCGAAGADRRFDEGDVAFATELADRAAAAIDNTRLYSQAVAANRIKTDFLAVMSHELRTPLNAVIGYADLLELEVRGPLGEQQRAYLERIRASAGHLLHLIEEILTFSRLDARGEQLQLETVDLRDVLQETAAMVRPLAEQKELTFRTAVPADPCPLLTDAGKLRQILINLLDNAVKFTARGEVELTARRAATHVEIRVRDTGIGIPPEHHRHLFEPFWQAEQAMTRRSSGAGLGLAVADHLTRLLDGTLAVESDPGHGTTFRLRLPLRAGAAVGGKEAGEARGKGKGKADSR
jgi:signal transduction histidine kinase